MKGSPISSGAQLREEDNGKDMKININQTEVEVMYSVPGTWLQGEQHLHLHRGISFVGRFLPVNIRYIARSSSRLS